MPIVSKGDNLLEMSKTVFWEKITKTKIQNHVIVWIWPENGEGKTKLSCFFFFFVFFLNSVNGIQSTLLRSYLAGQLTYSDFFWAGCLQKYLCTYFRL